MPPRPWILAETNWHSVRDATFDVAVLPWGATEAHNHHLPYGTDVIETERVAAEAGRIAWEAGARVIVLPTIPFGVQTGQIDIPLCINMNPSTQGAVLADIVASVEPHGIRKLVILNGHGGNDFKAIVRELQPDVDPFLCVVNWYAAADLSQHFDEPGDHAGEMETSMIMHLAPDLVLPLEEAGPGAERRFRIGALREGWAWAPRAWTSASADTGIGNPQAATAAKGEVFFAAVTERIAGFLCDLADADVDDLYG
ncbi:MAG TPA: creatininase family protein [Longimicrobiales bacterium]|nr:creatininase family protein [Longimicrobiales bacterium]